METWFQVNWGRAFLPQTSLLELIVRGSVIYLALFTLLRVILKRQSGTLGLTDLLVVVLIADAAQNAMANEYRSITEGLVLVSAHSMSRPHVVGPVCDSRTCAMLAARSRRPRACALDRKGGGPLPDPAVAPIDADPEGTGDGRDRRGSA